MTETNGLAVHHRSLHIGLSVVALQILWRCCCWVGPVGRGGLGLAVFGNRQWQKSDDRARGRARLAAGITVCAGIELADSRSSFNERAYSVKE
jgi:hypothetical protein